MAKLLPYFKWFPADAETDDFYATLTNDELAVYHRCLNRAWLNDGIPADLDTLAVLCRMDREQFDRIWAKVGRRWTPSERNPERLVNRRQEEERDSAIQKSIRNSAASAHGRSNTPGFIYLIRRPSDRSIKIGSSGNVATRLSQLKYKYREALNLVAKFPVENMGNSEVDLHERYKSQRLSGEWFSLSAKDESDIAITLGGDMQDHPEYHPPHHPTLRAYESVSISETDSFDFEQPDEERHGTVWFNASFERWWGSYWNKTAKVKARQAYEKRVKILVSKRRTHEQAEEFLIAAAIDDRSRFELTDAWGWRVNLNPPTWLNQERWNDQAPDAVAAKPTKGAECAWGRNGRCGRMAVSRGLCKEHLAVWESECAEEQTCR